MGQSRSPPYFVLKIGAEAYLWNTVVFRMLSWIRQWIQSSWNGRI